MNASAAWYIQAMTHWKRLVFSKVSQAVNASHMCASGSAQRRRRTSSGVSTGGHIINATALTCHNKTINPKEKLYATVDPWQAKYLMQDSDDALQCYDKVAAANFQTKSIDSTKLKDRCFIKASQGKRECKAMDRLKPLQGWCPFEMMDFLFQKKSDSAGPTGGRRLLGSGRRRKSTRRRRIAVTQLIGDISTLLNQVRSMTMPFTDDVDVKDFINIFRRTPETEAFLAVRQKEANLNSRINQAAKRQAALQRCENLDAEVQANEPLSLASGRLRFTITAHMCDETSLVSSTNQCQATTTRTWLGKGYWRNETWSKKRVEDNLKVSYAIPPEVPALVKTLFNESADPLTWVTTNMAGKMDVPGSGQESDTALYVSAYCRMDVSIEMKGCMSGAAFNLPNGERTHCETNHTSLVQTCADIQLSHSRDDMKCRKWFIKMDTRIRRKLVGTFEDIVQKGFFTGSLEMPYDASGNLNQVISGSAEQIANTKRRAARCMSRPTVPDLMAIAHSLPIELQISNELPSQIDNIHSKHFSM